MKNKPLWSVSVVTIPAAEEAVSELLQDFTDHGIASWTDVESKKTTATSYLSAKPNWPRLRAALKSGLATINEAGVEIGSAKILLRKLRHQDWAESWKRHFKPIDIGAALLIKPSWSKRKPRKGQAEIGRASCRERV